MLSPKIGLFWYISNIILLLFFPVKHFTKPDEILSQNKIAFDNKMHTLRLYHPVKDAECTYQSTG